MGNFNKNHPETQNGEVFLTNTDYIDGWADIEYIGWRTKRLGVISYDINGKIIERMRPVFVKKEELEQAGVDIE